MLTLRVDNHYVDGYKATRYMVVDVELPPMPLPKDDLEDWANEHLFEFTGTDTGRDNVDALYTVTVTASDFPDLVPVGSEFEWSG